ncbi:MAG: alpha/beta hydrolase [Saprospiraceae bacterium]
MTKKRLVIISDLWGREKADWLAFYTQVLEAIFEVNYYDSCELGGVDKTDYTEENLHRQFVNGGIEKAVENLIEVERKPINVLAFSVGGAIAWKFGMRTNMLHSLVCVSSTRLRKETAKPKGKVMLYFGAQDAFKPEESWFNQHEINREILANKAHQVYQEQQFAEQLSTTIIEAI